MLTITPCILGQEAVDFVRLLRVVLFVELHEPLLWRRHHAQLDSNFLERVRSTDSPAGFVSHPEKSRQDGGARHQQQEGDVRPSDFREISLGGDALFASRAGRVVIVVVLVVVVVVRRC